MSIAETSPGSERSTGPGRPASDASERIVEGTLEILSRDGYAGLTTAKVAAESGQNKAMISYYFGSKSGLISEVARQVADAVVEEVLGRVREPDSAGELVTGLVDGIVGLTIRDPRLPQVYIDLVSRSGVDDEPRRVLADMKSRFRLILAELLTNLDDPPEPERIPALSTYLIASLEGFMLEQLDRGETEDLVAARSMFTAAAESMILSR